jgi:SAM-dependent methyltransferase
MLARVRDARDPGNVSVNRRLWDRYVTRWTPETIDLSDIGIDDSRRQAYVREKISLPGDEWGRPEDVAEVVRACVEPYLTPTSEVLELGVGAGRVARLVAGRARRFVAADISPKMLKRARAELAAFPNVEFVLLDGPRLPRELDGRIDFAYTFDVLVHVDLHTMRDLFFELARVLKPGGKVFVHTANLLTEAGWSRFAGQERYQPAGFYFVSPEIVDTLLGRAGLTILEHPALGASNFYLARDYLVVAEKPS